MPRGGARPGAGRKPKRKLGNDLAQVVAHPSVPASAPVEIEEFDAPNDLTFDERQVWMELAPHAFKSRTLTKASALAFRMLCRNVVLEKMYATSVSDRGGASHRGLIQRVDAELLAFGLAPCGKPMANAELAKQAPVNPLDRFLTRSRA